jgi:hypothetical protein
MSIVSPHKPAYITPEELSWIDNVAEVRAYVNHKATEDIIRLQCLDGASVSVSRALVLARSKPPSDWEQRVYHDSHALLRVVIHMKWGRELSPTRATVESCRDICRYWNYVAGLHDWLNCDTHFFAECQN